MSSEYTPTTDDVRDAYERARYYLDEDMGATDGYRGGQGEFDRWLARVQAEAQVKVLREAAATMTDFTSARLAELRGVDLRARADSSHG